MSNFIYLTNYIARKIRYHRQIRGLSQEFFNFNSLEGDINSNNSLNPKRLTMKLKQLPKQQQATFIRIFEDIIDNLD